ncbi:MAG: amino acid ABC transporter substrate-binding protein, partial [Bacteroidetes bacterium]
MKRKLILVFVLIISATLFFSCSGAGKNTADTSDETVTKSDASTLEIVKERGYLICGVNASNPGFSYLDPDGKYVGFEADMGRAIAAAVLGDPEKIQFRPLTSKDRFAALQSGEIDLLIRTATHTLTRDT